ncbi:MAG: hypothetical protein KGH75_01230 [Rhodospirillales bacterium]|nr:hypothetical protein [Rhodospirillales bacterium]
MLSKKPSEVNAELTNLCESQKALIAQQQTALDGAQQNAVESSKRIAELEAKLGRLRAMLSGLGIDSAEIEEGTALWPTYAARMLSVGLDEDPDTVAHKLGDVAPTTRCQVVAAARRLIRPAAT